MKNTINMDEQCMECGASFDIHNLKNGLCYACNLDYVEDEISSDYYYDKMIKQ